MKKCLLGMAMAVFAAMPVRADDAAKAIVEKAIVAHGGKAALDKFKAFTADMKGDISIMGMELAIEGEMAFELPDKHMMSINMAVQGQKIHVITIANGTKQKSTMNGAVIPIQKAEKQEAKQMLMVQEASQLTPLIDSKKYTIKAEKDEDVKEVPTDVVLVTAEGMSDLKLYFDKKTHLLVKSSRKSMSPGAGGEGAEVLEESFMTAYKKVEGTMVATKLQVKHDGKKFMTLTLSEIKLMEKADAKIFAIDD